MRRLASAWAPALAGLATATTATANDQAGHFYITERAVSLVPDYCGLSELLTSDAVRPSLLNGSIFPDWGYGPGSSQAVRDAGEAMHWERMHDALRRQLVRTDGVWTEDEAEALAFYLGVTSHGLADQVYDSMYFERIAAYDDPDTADVDLLLGFVVADEADLPGRPDRLFPTDVLIEAYADEGREVTFEMMDQGHKWNLLAYGGLLTGAFVSARGARARYPWGAAHLFDLEAFGSPEVEAESVARYWQSNWALLRGKALPSPVLATYPRDGQSGRATAASNVESWVQVVLARGSLQPEVVDGAWFTIEASDGTQIPHAARLYYGTESHVVRLTPAEDLAADTVYTVTLRPGLPTVHGEALEGYSFRFGTGAASVAPMNPTLWADCPGGDDLRGGQGGSGSGGQPGTEPWTPIFTGGGGRAATGGAGGASGADETGGGGGGRAGGPARPSAPGTGGGQPGVAATDDESGCGCRTAKARAPLPLGWLALAALAAAVSRRGRTPSR